MGTATRHSYLCSEHFTQDCFEVESFIASSKKRQWKPDAIPTIFFRLPDAAVQTRPKRPSTISVTGESRGAVEKRERARVRNCITIIIRIQYATSIAKTFFITK